MVIYERRGESSVTRATEGGVGKEERWRLKRLSILDCYRTRFRFAELRRYAPRLTLTLTLF